MPSILVLFVFRRIQFLATWTHRLLECPYDMALGVPQVNNQESLRQKLQCLLCPSPGSYVFLLHSHNFLYTARVYDYQEMRIGGCPGLVSTVFHNPMSPCAKCSPLSWSSKVSCYRAVSSVSKNPIF